MTTTTQNKKDTKILLSCNQTCNEISTTSTEEIFSRLLKVESASKAENQASHYGSVA